MLTVKVEHCHTGNSKAPDDDTYRTAYSRYSKDRARWQEFKRAELPAAVARVHASMFGQGAHFSQAFRMYHYFGLGMLRF